jgi:hypothetical protein
MGIISNRNSSIVNLTSKRKNLQGDREQHLERFAQLKLISVLVPRPGDFDRLKLSQKSYW